jgi:hypothetical protein
MSEWAGNEVVAAVAAQCGPDPVLRAPLPVGRGTPLTRSATHAPPVGLGRHFCTAQGCGDPCDDEDLRLAPDAAWRGWTADAAIAAFDAGQVTMTWCGEVRTDPGDWTVTRRPGDLTVAETTWASGPDRVVRECPWRAVLRVPVTVAAPFLATPVETWLLVTGDDPAAWDLAGAPRPVSSDSDAEIVVVANPVAPVRPRTLAPGLEAALAASVVASTAAFSLPNVWGTRRTVVGTAETTSEQVRVTGTWRWAPGPGSAR